MSDPTNDRTSEIRAVLDEVDRSGACEGDGAYLASQLDRIRAILDSAPTAPEGTPNGGDRVTGVETQTIGQPTVTGYFHSSGVDGLSWLKINADDPETAQRYLVGTATLKPCTPPAPRVFFPGELIPGGMATQNEHGTITRCAMSLQSSTTEVRLKTAAHRLSPEEWQAAVARARAEREES